MPLLTTIRNTFDKWTLAEAIRLTGATVRRRLTGRPAAILAENQLLNDLKSAGYRVGRQDDVSC